MSSAGVGGYTCSVCGMFVSFGAFHSCGGSPSYVPQPDAAVWAQNATLNRIAELLERIAQTLAAWVKVNSRDPGAP